VVDHERAAGAVGDVAVGDLELGLAAVSRLVVEREIAVDPVPRSVEVERELLDYVERAVVVDGEQCNECPKANAAALRLRAT
jgi:hypothetical protein